MEVDPNDQKVFDLLSKLRDAGGSYPVENFASRRQSYLQHAAQIDLGAGAGLGLKNILKSGKSPGSAPSTVTSKVLETILVLAIVVEAGTISYLYRDKLLDLIHSLSPSPLVEESSSPKLEISITPITPIGTQTITSTKDITETMTITATTTPSASELTGQNGNPRITATPTKKENPGNHFGQTPKPTKVKKNNGSGKETYHSP